MKRKTYALMLLSFTFIFTSLAMSAHALYYINLKSQWTHDITEHRNKYDDNFNIQSKQLSISITFAGDAQWSQAGCWVIILDEGYETYNDLQAAYGEKLYDMSYPNGYESGVPGHGGAAQESEYFQGFLDEDDSFVAWSMEIDNEWFDAGNWYRIFIRLNGSADEYSTPTSDNQWLRGKSNDYVLTFFVNSLGAVVEYTNTTEVTNEYLDWIGDIVIAFMEEWGFQTFSGGVTITGIIFKLINRKENYYEM